MYFVPNAGELSQMLSQAMAPAFMLGAVAGYVSVMLGRIATIVDRIRALNDVPDNDGDRARLKSDIPRLRKRARLLNSAGFLALTSGLCTCLLLIVGFASAFVKVPYVYGAGILFVVAVSLLGASLFKFGQEVKIGLSEADHYR